MNVERYILKAQADDGKVEVTPLDDRWSWQVRMRDVPGVAWLLDNETETVEIIVEFSTAATGGAR